MSLHNKPYRSSNIKNNYNQNMVLQLRGSKKRIWERVRRIYATNVAHSIHLGRILGYSQKKKKWQDFGLGYRPLMFD